MDRRHFLAASLLSIARTPAEGQLADPGLGMETPDSPIRMAVSLPDLNGATEWFNTAPLRKRDLRGKVVLVNFWTYSCINSLRPLPYLKKWAAQYRNSGLVVLGVHTPEFNFEKQRANVDWAVHEFRVTYPVAMDNDYRIWRSFGNDSWPAFYLVDGNGRIRHHRSGEGQYADTESALQTLMNRNGASGPTLGGAVPLAEGIEAPPGRDVRTPETYVGYRRAERFGSAERVARDSRRAYTAPASLRLNQWGLNGVWEVGPESGLLREAHGKITFHFHSRDLHLVLGPSETGRLVRFQVTLDGAAPGREAGADCSSDGMGDIREPRLYQLIRQKSAVRDRTFQIGFLDSGVRAYSFTFG